MGAKNLIVPTTTICSNNGDGSDDEAAHIQYKRQTAQSTLLPK